MSPREPQLLETMAPLDGAERARLRFEPEGAEVRVPSGTPVFDAASWNGIAIDSTCGGHGTCKKCKVRVLEGDVPVSAVDPRAFSTDELRAGWRLACRAPARGELVIEVPPLQTRPKAALVGVGRHVILRPSVQKRHLVLEEPTMEDQRSDFERLQDALEDLEPRAELPVLRTLGRVLRNANWNVTAVVADDVLIDVEPGDTTARRFAIAFDLGTTTVVATLLDLETGTPAAVQSMLNRQQPFGADVITRISATMMDEGALDALQQRAQETLAQLTEEVCAEARVDPGEVYEITLCGNVTMTQLALGIDPEPLSMAPFVVTTHDPPPLAASDFGVPVHPRAPAFAFPSLGAYVGGDIVAGMLATGLTRDKRLRLFIDVGTNSEIALGNQDVVVATAAPAGPAFEAAQIRCGMRAADGAIEGVKIADGELALEVIGDVEPVGMCGSGLVDCVAELVSAGLLDHSGRFADDATAAEVAPGARGPADADRQGARVRDALARQRPRRRRLPLPARRARAAVREGVDRDRLADPARRAGRQARGRRAGAAGRLVRRLPLAVERDPHRARAADGAAADRVGRQRRGGGGEDRRAQPARARRGATRSCTRSATSSSPAGPTSTTASSTSSRSRDERRRGRRDRLRRARRRRAPDRAPPRLGRRRAPVPALLHNRPERIAPAVAAEARAAGRPLRARRRRLRRLRHLRRARRRSACARLRGEHCYDVFGAPRCARRSRRSPAPTS